MESLNTFEIILLILMGLILVINGLFVWSIRNLINKPKKIQSPHCDTGLRRRTTDTKSNGTQLYGRRWEDQPNENI